MAEERSSHPVAKGLVQFCNTKLSTIDQSLCKKEGKDLSHSDSNDNSNNSNNNSNNSHSSTVNDNLNCVVIPGKGIKMTQSDAAGDDDILSIY
jgi:hypothetical protein